MRVKNESLISGATSLVSNWQSLALWLGHVSQYSIQLAFSAGTSGTFYLQVSDDEGNIAAQTQSNQDARITHWTTLVGTEQDVAEGGTHVWDIEAAGHNWVRACFTADTSTGTLTSARCYTKGV